MAARELVPGGGRRGARVWAGVAVALVASIGALGCTALDDAFASVPFLNTMRWAPSFDPYENPRPAPPGAVPFESPGGAVLLPPVEATEASLNAFAARVTNPVTADSATLERGRLMYERYCLVCHGTDGAGQGPIVGPGRFPPVVPDLRMPASRARSDGYIYGVMHAGRGLMPAYGAQTTHMDRWYIVNYIRSLQQQPPTQAPAGGPGPQAPGAQQGTE